MFVCGRVRFTNWFEQVDLGASLVCPKVTLGTVASQGGSIRQHPQASGPLRQSWVHNLGKNSRQEPERESSVQRDCMGSNKI